MSETSSIPGGKKALDLEVGKLDIGRRTVYSHLVQKERDMLDGGEVSVEARFGLLDRAVGMEDGEVKTALDNMELASSMKDSEKRGYKPGDFKGYTAGFDVKDD